MNKSRSVFHNMLNLGCLAVVLIILSFCTNRYESSGSSQIENNRFNKYKRSINLFADTSRTDQDDMCVWVHPDDASKSTIISSDKGAKKLFVYDLSGNIIQSINVVSKPGNIDIRYNYPLNGEKVDIVAYNDRGSELVKIYKVDSTIGKLSCIDDGNIKTGENYGFSLYISPVTKKYYAFVSSYHVESEIRQFELMDNGNGEISGKLVRKFDIVDKQIVEGMVADDEQAKLYIGEEGVGIRKYNAEPDGGLEGELIRSIVNDSLEADVEGLTMYYLPDGKGYIIASSQHDGKGFNTHYDVFEREAPHLYITSFMLDSVGSTDGIDVCGANLGSAFPQGIFLAHNGSQDKQIVVIDWGKIAEGEGLTVDVDYGNPRK